MRAERDELAVAERVWKRMAKQLTTEQVAAAPAAVQVTGHAVLLVPHRGRGVDVDSLPPNYQRILALVRGAGGRSWSNRSARRWSWRWRCGASWSRCVGRCPKLAGRGWLRKLPDGRFTTRL